MDEAVQGMADFTLDQLSLTKGSKLLYVYDFLRMWCFYIEVLEIEEGAQEFPNVVYSFGTAPKENSKEIEFDLGLDEDIQTTANEKKPYDLDDDELDNLSDSDMFDSLDDY